jgi:hypothetical protein
MSHFGSPSVVCLAVVLLLRMAGSPVAVSQADGAAQSGTRIATALRFLRAVYPDQEDISGRVQIEGELLRGMDTRHFGVQLGGGLLTLRNGADLSRAQCYGRFRFTDFGLVEFFGHGTCAMETKNAAFVTVVESHPQWSDEQVAAELARRDARFGPDAKDQLKGRIPPTYVVADAVGELVELRDIAFEMPRREDGRMLDSVVSWRITYAVLGKNNVSVVARLEPFDCRLTFLIRLPPE